jgi:prevent-host-death family protein
MNVGIRDLKAHLSDYLRRAAEGETLQVTDRGRPIALITPVAPADPLARAVEEGWVRAPVTEQRIGHVTRGSARRRVLDVVREDRGE